MKLILSILVFFAWLPSGVLRAASAASDAPPTYRYLILIDTSFSMARTKEATARTVRELIISGVQGRMQRGDTLGLWIFNEEVETRRFPTFLWAPEQSESLAERAVYLFKKEKFEKQTRMDKALAEMFKAVQSTELLTVFIISDGDEPIVGTPFDRSINAIYRQYARSLRREKKPFVTMFVAQDGELNSWSVHTGGSIIVLPDLPQPRRAVQEALPPTIVTNVAPLPAPSAVAAAPPTAPPIETAKKEPIPDSAKERPPTQTPVALPPAAKQVESVASTAPLPGAASPEIVIRQATEPPVPKTTTAQTTVSVTPLPATQTAAERASDLAPERSPAQTPPSTAVATQTAPTPPPAGMIVPPDQNVTFWRFLALGSLLVLITGLLLLYRNYRAPRQPSFISRSMNSEGK